LNENWIGAVVIGAAAAAIGTVLAWKYITYGPAGGSTPLQQRSYQPTARSGVVDVRYPEMLPYEAAPVHQPMPITEAAYNQQPTDLYPAFGPVANRDSMELVLPY